MNLLVQIFCENSCLEKPLQSLGIAKPLQTLGIAKLLQTFLCEITDGIGKCKFLCEIEALCLFSKPCKNTTA